MAHDGNVGQEFLADGLLDPTAIRHERDTIFYQARPTQALFYEGEGGRGGEWGREGLGAAAVVATSSHQHQPLAAHARAQEWQVVNFSSFSRS